MCLTRFFNSWATSKSSSEVGEVGQCISLLLQQTVQLIHLVALDVQQ